MVRFLALMLVAREAAGDFFPLEVFVLSGFGYAMPVLWQVELTLLLVIAWLYCCTRNIGFAWVSPVTGEQC